MTMSRDAEERLKQLDAADIQLRREMDKLPTETYELHASVVLLRSMGSVRARACH